VAGNQIGAIYLAQVEAGNYDVFEHGRAALQTVIRAYDDRQFGSTYADLPVVASAALYHLGRLYSAMAQRDSNAIDTSSLVEAKAYLERSRDVLRTMDLQVSAHQSDELHWRATAELGHIYRLWGESGDTFMYGDALNTYQEVLDAIGNGVIADGEVAANLFSEAAYGLGAVYHAQGDDEQAVEYLNLAIDARNSRPIFVESAQRLLQDIAGPDASGD
jgi:tetratricopeptide (TPR) repeat protein